MKRCLVFLPMVILMALFLGCRCEQETVAQVDLGKEKAAATELMNQFWQSFETGDINLVSEVMAHDSDMVVIGTDAAELWVGYDDFEAAMEQQFAAMESLGVSLDDEALKVHGSGEVAWYSGIAGFKGTSMGEDFEFDGMRVTAVLEKRDAKWVIVQYHGSAPVTGSLVEY